MNENDNESALYLLLFEGTRNEAKSGTNLIARFLNSCLSLLGKLLELDLCSGFWLLFLKKGGLQIVIFTINYLMRNHYDLRKR